MNEERNMRIALLAGVIFAAAMARFVPHVPNLTPVGALALFAGAQIGRKALAFIVPLAALLLSDLILEVTAGIGFHSTIGWVYGAFALIVGLGFLVRKVGIGPLTVAGGALGASGIFFFVSNFGVWMSTPLYPKTAAGLAACFTAAIPFYWSTLAGDLIWTGVLFGAWEVIRRSRPALQASN